MTAEQKREDTETPIQRVLGAVFDGEPKTLTETHFDALGGLAARAIISGDFEAVRELQRKLGNRSVGGWYSPIVVARLEGMVDVLGNAIRYTPSRISQEDYDLLQMADDVFRTGEISNELFRLREKGFVGIILIGDTYAVRLTPRGVEAMDTYSLNLPAPEPSPLTTE